MQSCIILGLMGLMQYVLTEQDWLGISKSQFVRYLL